MGVRAMMAGGGPMMSVIALFGPGMLVVALLAFGLAFKRVRVPAALWVLPMLAVVVVGMAGSLHGISATSAVLEGGSAALRPRLAGDGLGMVAYPAVLAGWIGAIGAGLTAFALGLGHLAASGDRAFRARLTFPGVALVGVAFVLIATRGFLGAVAVGLVGTGVILGLGRLPNDAEGPEGVAMLGVRKAVSLLTGVAGGFSGVAILATTMGGIGRVRGGATQLVRDRMTVQYLDDGLFQGQVYTLVIGLGALSLLTALVTSRPAIRWGRLAIDAVVVVAASVVLSSAVLPVWFGAHALFEASTPIEVLRRPVIGKAGIELATVDIASELNPAPVLTLGVSGATWNDEPLPVTLPTGLEDVHVEIGRARGVGDLTPFLPVLSGATVHWVVQQRGTLGAVQTTVFGADRPERRFGIANTDAGWLLLERKEEGWVRVARSFDPDKLPFDLHSSRFQYMDLWPGDQTIEEMLVRVAGWSGRAAGRQVAIRLDPVPAHGALTASRFLYRVDDIVNPEFPAADVRRRLSALEFTLESCVPVSAVQLPLTFEVGLSVGEGGQLTSVELTESAMDDAAWSQCVADLFGDLELPAPMSGTAASLVVPVRLTER